MSGETDPPEIDDDPIDAEYEPAPAVSEVSHEAGMTKKGPGWLALGATGVLAAVFGGGAGAMLSGNNGAANGPALTIEDIQEANQQNDQANLTLEKTLTDLVAGLDERTREDIGRVRNEVSAIAASSGDADAIADLSDQMNAINAQFEALDVAAQESGEVEGVQVDQLLARIESLEKLDENEVASPRVANRAVRAVQRRVDELEAELATRQEALQEIATRLEAAEALLEEASSKEAGEAEAGRGDNALAEENAKAIAALEETVTALGERALETGRSSQEQERLTRWVEELRAKEALNRQTLETNGAGQAAITSLLSIESAARDGRSFQAAFARLEEALPRNRSVAKLKPLAAKGAPTLSILQADFAGARAAAEELLAEADAGNADGWGWVRRAMGDAVVVRRSGDVPEVEAGSAQAAIAAADERLAARDLEGAINEIKGLEASLQVPFEDWMKAASGRQALEDGLDELRLTLMNAER